MKIQTKYAYQKRISELEKANADLQNSLFNYRTTCMEIFDAITDNFANKQGTSESWILKRMKRCFE